MNISQRLHNEGREEGREETQIEIVQKGLANGATIEFMCIITGLSREKNIKLQSAN